MPPMEMFENSVILNKARKAPLSAKLYIALLIGVIVYIVLFGCASAHEAATDTGSIAGTVSWLDSAPANPAGLM